MTQEIKLSDASLLLGMAVGLIHTVIQFVPESSTRDKLEEQFDELQGMIQKIYYQDYE